MTMPGRQSIGSSKPYWRAKTNVWMPNNFMDAQKIGSGRVRNALPLEPHKIGCAKRRDSPTIGCGISCIGGGLLFPLGGGAGIAIGRVVGIFNDAYFCHFLIGNGDFYSTLVPPALSPVMILIRSRCCLAMNGSDDIGWQVIFFAIGH